MSAYSTYWEALHEYGPGGVRILMSETMTHEELCDDFLEGLSRPCEVKQLEDDLFADALKAHLTP